MAQLDSDRVTHYRLPGGTGYAQRDGEFAELAAESPQRLAELLDQVVADGATTVWAHGTRSPLRDVLRAAGFRPVRALHQLRRPAGAPLPPDEVPDGVAIRTFRPGDESELLRVNAAAFATHPEQGAWTRTDLDARKQEDWFDPGGLFVAERGNGLLGFHWTKCHPDGAGEVYVIGVDPAAQGLGLGTVLLARGLSHLDESGCPYVLLYVDDDNAGALRLYEKYGFTRFDLDEQWALH